MMTHTIFRKPCSVGILRIFPFGQLRKPKAAGYYRED